MPWFSGASVMSTISWLDGENPRSLTRNSLTFMASLMQPLSSCPEP